MRRFVTPCLFVLIQQFGPPGWVKKPLAPSERIRDDEVSDYVRELERAYMDIKGLTSAWQVEEGMAGNW